MSTGYFGRIRSNNTPFCDVCELVAATTEEDADGYETVAETRRQVFCSVSRGIVRAEYYEAMRSNVQLSMTVEVWEEDFDDAEHLVFNEKRYKIGRVFPTGYGTLEMVCTEVKR